MFLRIVQSVIDSSILCFTMRRQGAVDLVDLIHEHGACASCAGGLELAAAKVPCLNLLWTTM